MPVVVARGLELHVQELGERSTRASVVMLHGLLLGSIASWYFTSAPSLAKSRRVFLFDLRGHGKSARPRDGYGVASMRDDLEALADGFDDRPLDLVGHSYGALVALRFALDRPSRVRRLVLVEPPLPPSQVGEMEAFAKQAPGRMMESLPEAVRAFVQGGGRRAAKLIESLKFLMNETTLPDDLAKEKDIADEELAKLGAPLLVVAGDRSSCLSSSERIARVVPRAKLVVLKGGHFLHLNAPVELTAAITEHLDG